MCDEAWSSDTQAQVYLVCYTTLTMFAPLILTSTSYCFVWRAFRVSQRRVNVMNTLKRPKTASYLPYASKTEIRLLKMLFFMVFCFVVLWSPLVVHWFLKYFKTDLVLSEYLILTNEWFCRIEPVLDPIIYGYLNKQFRKSLRDMLRVCSQCSAYYSTNTHISTGDNNSPGSSDLYDDHYSGQIGDDARADDGASDPFCLTCTHCVPVMGSATVATTGAVTNELQALGVHAATPAPPPGTTTTSATTSKAIVSKEAPAGSISYISKTDPAAQKRASLTYHISGSVKLMPDTRDNEDTATNRPKAPVWYLGGTFPLDTNPIRNVGRLPPTGSQEPINKRPLERQNALQRSDSNATTADTSTPETRSGKSMKSNRKQRKRKKILSKRIEAKKCYSAGGVYLGPQS